MQTLNLEDTAKVAKMASALSRLHTDDRPYTAHDWRFDLKLAFYAHTGEDMGTFDLDTQARLGLITAP